MALISCTECGKEISSSAAACPNCGAPVAEDFGCFQLIGITCVILVTVVFCTGLILAIPSINKTPPESKKWAHAPAVKPVQTAKRVKAPAIQRGARAARSISADLQIAVKGLRESGFLIDFTPELNRALVSRDLWNGATVDQKRQIGYVLGHYCGDTKGTRIYWVDIMDGHSGKKLAKWSESSGLKVE